jgi:hypothetical protein
MQTRKQWTEYKKKKGIPDGAVEGVDLGPAIEKCAKVVNGDGKPADKLKAVLTFRKTWLAYTRGLDSTNKPKAKAFIDLLNGELDAVEKEAFDAAAKKADGKGVVVDLDPKDDTIKTSSQSIADKRKLGADKPLRRPGDKDDGTDDKGHDAPVTRKEADFSKASKEPIVILAHGTPIGKPGSGKVRASHFAGKSASDIVAFIAKTLEPTYYGVIYLDGCFTAAGKSPLNFGKLVYDGLVKKGYHYLQIKGNLGAAITVDGKEFVVPAELDDHYDRMKKERDTLDKELAAMRKQYDEAKLALGPKMMALLKGRLPKDLTGTEAKAYEQLEKAADSVQKLQSENKDLQRKQARRDQVDTIIEKNLKIEALTGTFGPERLPPR